MIQRLQTKTSPTYFGDTRDVRNPPFMSCLHNMFLMAWLLINAWYVWREWRFFLMAMTSSIKLLTKPFTVGAPWKLHETPYLKINPTQINLMQEVSTLQSTCRLFRFDILTLSYWNCNVISVCDSILQWYIIYQLGKDTCTKAYFFVRFSPESLRKTQFSLKNNKKLDIHCIVFDFMLICFSQS